MIKVLTYDRDPGRDAQINSTFALSNTIYPLAHSRHLGGLAEEITYLKPDLLLLDSLHSLLPDTKALYRLHRMFPDLKVFLQLNDEDRKEIFEWLKSGIHGCVLRGESIRTILLGIDCIISDGAFISPGVAVRLMVYDNDKGNPTETEQKLTAKEIDILKLLARGMSYKMIAIELKVSYHTVSTHIRNMYQKRGVHSVTELLAACRPLLEAAVSPEVSD